MLSGGVECGRRGVVSVGVQVRRMVRRVLRAAVLGCCVVVLVRRVLRAAKPGWREMSVVELRGADCALLADEGLVVGLLVRGLPNNSGCICFDLEDVW